MEWTVKMVIIRGFALLAGAVMCVGCSMLPSNSSDEPVDIFSASNQDQELLTSMLPQAEKYVTPHYTEKDISQWLLPTDVLLARRSGLLEIEVASTLTKQCMDKAGHPQYQRSTDASAPFPETEPSSSQVFTVEIAQKYGYRNAPDPTILNMDVLLNDTGYQSQSHEFREAWYQCMNEAEDQVLAALGRVRPSPDEISEKTPEQELYSSLNQLSVDTAKEPLQSAAHLWRECMAPLGIADLPTEPSMGFGARRVPESLKEQWQWEIYGAPTAEEVRVAVHDAQCRQQSGWTQHYYDTEWQQAEDLLQGKEDLIKSSQDRQRQEAAALLALRSTIDVSQ